MLNNNELHAPLASKDIQQFKDKQPPKEPLRQPEKLLNEQFTGAQALMLLGITPPEKGKSAPRLEEKSIIESANKGIPPSHKEKIRKASFNERDEYWSKDEYKGMSFEEKKQIWTEKTNEFLDKYKNDPKNIAQLTFLKKILKRDDQKDLSDVQVTADNIYNTFMLGEGKGDVEFFARRIVDRTNNNITEIKENEVLIKKLGKIYGDNSTKIAELLTHGIANVKNDSAAFLKSAQENLDKGISGEIIDVYTKLVKNTNEWDTKEDKKKQVISKPQSTPSGQENKEDEEKQKVEKVKNDIFTLAESKNQTQAKELLTEVQKILIEEKEEGKGKLKATIEETAKERNEYIREGQVVFIPEGKGELVVVSDLHGDLKTLKQVLEKSKFIENMEVDEKAGGKSMQFVQMGDLVDRGPKQVEVMQLVLELKRRYPKNVTIFKADHEVYNEGVSDHNFPYKIKEYYEIYLDPKAELDDPLFGGFFKVFEELPRMAVAANGAVLAHGGPAVKPRTLSELGNLPPDEVKRVFDREITWGDPVTKDIIENLEKEKEELIQHTQKILDEVKEDKGIKDDDFIELRKYKNRKVTQSKILSNRSIGRIKENLKYLEDLPEGFFQESGKESKEALISSTKEFLDKNQNKADDVEVKFRDINFPPTERQKIGILKQALEVMKSTPNFYPHARRMRRKSFWEAYVARTFKYSEEGLSRFLEGVGGNFMLRGHQTSEEVSGVEAKMFDGKLWTIHTTGKGSDESDYKGRESDPKYAVFKLNEKQNKIKKENIISVWQ